MKPLSKRASTGAFTSNLTQLYQTEYLIDITVGTPPQPLAVTLDTGSSDLWIPSISSTLCEAGSCDGSSFNATESSTYKLLSKATFSITYEQPNDTDAGDLATDNVAFVGADAVVKDLQFGLAQMESVDKHGVMGLAYSAGESTGNEQNATTYPDIMDQLKAQGVLQRKAYSLWLNDPNSNSGSVIFGGIDTTKYEDSLIGLPVQASLYTLGQYAAMAVTLTSVSYSDNSDSTLLTNGSTSLTAILDSGTTISYLPADIFEKIVNRFGVLDVDNNTVVPCRWAESTATISYGFGGVGGPVIHIPVSSLILNQTIPGERFADPSGACQFGIGPAEYGLTILGDTFLRYAYVVYDLDNNEIAMAPAKFNVTSSNIEVLPAGTGFPGVSTMATAAATELDFATASAPEASTGTGGVVATGHATFAHTTTRATSTSTSAATASPKLGFGVAGKRVTVGNAWTVILAMFLGT